MDILIPDSWLRDFLKTQATTKQISEYLSLCGPSVEKAENGVYSIEVTTNRVDVASVYGIAREAAAILPQFNLKASFSSIKTPSLKFKGQVSYLDAKVDFKLCPRFTAVLIKNVKIKDSPDWVKERLLAVGVRPINNVVDISNYVMHELGQPVHTFDYNKIKGAKMILREGRSGEKLTTLDGKLHTLKGGDIVIEDGSGRLIDLAGIMGGENSAVDENSKNILLFVQTYNPVNIRATSMSLAQRSEAAVLFEKGLDPELVTLGMARGIELFVKLTGGRPQKEILDIYPDPYKPKSISLDLEFIKARLGTEIDKKKIDSILKSLGFETSWNKGNLQVSVPSYRASDMSIPEDVVEEIARIYGYRNLPSELMSGALPEPPSDSPFLFETEVKNTLKGFGAVEVYTFSLVPENFVEGNALKLKNPLGSDSEYLRTSLMPSLIAAANENLGEKEPFHLFEAANVYLPQKGSLPEEKMMLAGIFSDTDFREARGVVEGLFAEFNLEGKFNPEESAHFAPSRRLVVSMSGREIGQFGVLENGKVYYEFDLALLKKSLKPRSFRASSKYPPQIEDITLTFPEKTKIGEVIESIQATDKLVSEVELKDIYKYSYTFRVWYQHPAKTLIDIEVEKVRDKLTKELKNKFGAIVKS